MGTFTMRGHLRSYDKDGVQHSIRHSRKPHPVRKLILLSVLQKRSFTISVTLREWKVFDVFAAVTLTLTR